MNNKQYRTEIERTMNKELSEKDKVTMLALGIAGEAGEVADSLKKIIYHGHGLDRDKLVEELGDLEYYLQHLKKHYNIHDKEVYIENIKKLKKRYPQGFSEEASRNRTV